MGNVECSSDDSLQEQDIGWGRIKGAVFEDGRYLPHDPATISLRASNCCTINQDANKMKSY